MKKSIERIVFLSLLSAVALPLAALALWSATRHWYYPRLLPADYDATAWAQLFRGTGALWEAALTSLLIAAIVTAVATAIGFPSGKFLAQPGGTQPKTMKILTWLLLFPALAPPLALGTGLQLFYIKLGLTGTLQGVVLAHLLPTLPFAAFVSAGMHANFNSRCEEQARTLGATPLQTLWHVTRPALQSGVIVVALFSFLISWAQYALTIQIGYGRITTLPMLVFGYLGGGSTQFAAAAGLIIMVIPVVAIISLARFNAFKIGIGQW